MFPVITLYPKRGNKAKEIDNVIVQMYVSKFIHVWK